MTFGVSMIGLDYRNVDKGLLSIYQLLTGDSGTVIDSQFIPKSSYQSLSHELFVKQYSALNNGR